LNEFLKEHRQLDKQQAIISELQSTVATLRKDFLAITESQRKQIEALRAGLQKISAQVGENALETEVIAHVQAAMTRKDSSNTSLN
jgi:low affinity Fe/Cu permease